MSRPTREELAARVEFTAWLLCRGLQKGTVKLTLYQRYGVSRATAERLIARARKAIIAASGKTKEQHFQEAVNFFDAVVTGPEGTLREKLLAQHLLCRLLGLYPPRRVQHGGDPASPPIRQKQVGPSFAEAVESLSVDELRQLRDLEARVMQRTTPSEN